MRIQLLPIVFILLLFGCGDSEMLPISEFSGKLNNESVTGSGLVFQWEDSTLHIRAIVGTGDNFHQMDVTLNTRDVRDDSDHILTDSTASVALVIGRDAVTNRYSSSDANSFISLSIDFENSIAEGDLRYIGEDSSGDKLEIEGSFKFIVGEIDNTIWDCDFENGPISNCRFL